MDFVGDKDGVSDGDAVGEKVPISFLMARSAVLQTVMRLSSMKVDSFGFMLIPALSPTQQLGIFNTKEQKQDPYTKFDIREKGRRLYSTRSIAPRLRVETNVKYSSSTTFKSPS